jgi:hypothetical protein
MERYAIIRKVRRGFPKSMPTPKDLKRDLDPT